jgi:hypothetical protein
VAVIITVVLFRGDPIFTTLQFALVLLVAAIPVAMPTVLSVTMAVGARLLAKKSCDPVVGYRGTSWRGRAVLGQDRHPDPEQADAGRSIQRQRYPCRLVLWRVLCGRSYQAYGAVPDRLRPPCSRLMQRRFPRARDSGCSRLRSSEHSRVVVIFPTDD